MRDRAAAEARGRVAEYVAAIWLMAKGYRILAHRARTPFGEVDLAALKGRVLAIVEVKARPTREAGLVSIGLNQRERVMRAGLSLMKRYRLPHASVRLDLMIMRPWRAPIHVRDAWREDGS